METTIEKPISKLAGLVGKRICIVGFGSKEVSAVRDALESAEAFCRVVGVGGEEALLSGFDLALFQIDDPAVRGWLQEVRPTHTIPVLMMGQIATVMNELADLLNPSTDFLASEPFSEQEFLLRALKLTRSTAAGGADVPQRTKPLVLVVEDDNAIVSLLKTVLTKAGLDCHTARDGNAGLEMAKQLKPDLMILDVNMPHRNGFDVLKVLKQSPETASVKVLFLTGSVQEADILRGFGLGADDYVTKPFNPMEIGARVKSILGRQK